MTWDTVFACTLKRRLLKVLSQLNDLAWNTPVDLAYVSSSGHGYDAKLSMPYASFAEAYLGLECAVSIVMNRDDPQHGPAHSWVFVKRRHRGVTLETEYRIEQVWWDLAQNEMLSGRCRMPNKDVRMIHEVIVEAAKQQ